MVYIVVNLQLGLLISFSVALVYFTFISFNIERTIDSERLLTTLFDLYAVQELTLKNC